MTDSHDLAELRRTVRKFLEAKSSSDDVRRTMRADLGYDADVWSQMAGQLGLQGLAIPEEYGGCGFGLVEQVTVLEEMGRSLLCAPYFASAVLASTALLASDDEAARSSFLPRIADGSLVATLAWVEDAAAWRSASWTTTATPCADGFVLNGSKTLVLDGHHASIVLVVATSPCGPSLFVIDPRSPGVTRRQLESLDMTRQLSELSLSDAPARLVGHEGGADVILDRTLQVAAVALAAEQLGGAQRCLDMAVEYAKLRVQFGRAIGTFQAIKHMCADMLLEVESARSAVLFASQAVASHSDDAQLLASLAKAYSSEAFAKAATDNIQVHGGIGFTWEHDAHLFYRRAKSTEQLLGSPTMHRDVMAAELLKTERMA